MSRVDIEMIEQCEGVVGHVPQPVWHVHGCLSRDSPSHIAERNLAVEVGRLAGIAIVQPNQRDTPCNQSMDQCRIPIDQLAAEAVDEQDGLAAGPVDLERDIASGQVCDLRHTRSVGSSPDS